MKISQKELETKASVYVKDGLLTKFRGTASTGFPLDAMITAKAEKRALNENELDFIKTLDGVVIENEKVIQFYNFTGFAVKF